jgi:hypothetical protein
MENREHYLKSFLVAGLVMGLLSVVPGLNCCCCAWVVLGGFLAGYILCGAAKSAVRPGEGAMVGLMAGLIGGMIFSMGEVFQKVVDPAMFKDQMEQQMRSQGVNIPPEAMQLIEQSIRFLTSPGLLMGARVFFYLLIFAIIAMLGATTAVYIMEPRFALKRIASQGFAPAPVSAAAPPPVIRVPAVTPAASAPELREVRVEAPVSGNLPEETDLYFPRKPKEET